jgi:D-aminopeptidase
MSDTHLPLRPAIGMLPCGPLGTIADTRLDPLFQACADSVEQAIVDALWSATSLSGRDGHRRLSLLDAAPDLARLLT